MRPVFLRLLRVGGCWINITGIREEIFKSVSTARFSRFLKRIFSILWKVNRQKLSVFKSSRVSLLEALISADSPPVFPGIKIALFLNPIFSRLLKAHSEGANRISENLIAIILKISSGNGSRQQNERSPASI